jgi:hypothetical protein
VCVAVIITLAAGTPVIFAAWSRAARDVQRQAREVTADDGRLHSTAFEDHGLGVKRIVRAGRDDDRERRPLRHLERHLRRRRDVDGCLPKAKPFSGKRGRDQHRADHGDGAQPPAKTLHAVEGAHFSSLIRIFR